MKTKKLYLKDIEVRSFITSVEAEDQHLYKGGNTGSNCPTPPSPTFLPQNGICQTDIQSLQQCISDIAC